MPVGPFDRRKKRSRCTSCSTRHLKCSGDTPCANCNKKGIPCEYPGAQQNKGIIVLDTRTQRTLHSFPQSSEKGASKKTCSLFRSPSPDPSSYYFYYFDVFIRKNKFTSQPSFQSDIRRLIHQSPAGRFLIDAMLSLGAMEALKLRALGNNPENEMKAFAYSSYSSSISGLRSALVSAVTEPHIRQTVLWTTHILGLFELMSDVTGYGWIQHIVHGTSKALVASGSHACRAGSGKRFFMEAKIFEVCRAIIFNEHTFLTGTEWMTLSVSLRQEEDDVGWNHLDALLDVITECSTLRVRASTFIDSLAVLTEDEAITQGSSISAEGFRLRTLLFTWFSTGIALQNSTQHSPSTNGSSTGSSSSSSSSTSPSSSSPSSSSLSSSDTESFILLAQIFFAATSVYLSGVFDYEIVHWQELGIVVSTLAEEEIQSHVKTILELSQVITKASDVSPVLLLFPLRVAGARAFEEWQQNWIIGLLEEIEVTFSVATAFKVELEKVWSLRRSGTPVAC